MEISPESVIVSSAGIVCFVGGCGRLGLALAAWSAECGMSVTCADVNEVAVQSINERMFISPEPGVTDMVNKHIGTSLRCTTDIVSSVALSDVSFVIVPTPTAEDGSFSDKYVLDACKEIGEALKQQDFYHLVVIVSTVMPGTTSGVILETLEQVSGKKAGNHFGLVYSPEFIRQRNILQDFAHPSQILIGAIDSRSADMASRYYVRVTKSRAPHLYMSPTSAEVAKIGLNAALATKKAIANQLLWLCDDYAEAEIRDVIHSVGADPRIGDRFFRPGTATGGPCLPRDNVALSVAASRVGVRMPISTAVTYYNELQADMLASVVKKHTLKFGTVGLLGTTYKPGVPIMEGSPTIDLAMRLHDRGYSVYDYDKCAEAISWIQRADSIVELVQRASTIVVMTIDGEFQQLEGMNLEGKTVIDVWGFLDQSKLNCEYIRIGGAK
jgi:UDPglucose 6-dehydrogenase